ncbi:MAG: Zn-dependent exopeptidase M28 [Candidatus Aminicenantes bacterium]|nr:Zn-dependent exopeptidase M28 [Candidatus Aminicenantes bacterium]
MTRKRTLWIAIAAAVLTAGFVVAASGVSEKALVRVDKRDLMRLPEEALAGLQGLQELESSWIILASESDLAEFGARRIPAEILDARPGGKAHFLVFSRSAEDMARLYAHGEVRPLEGGAVLFWSGGNEAREILPAEFSLKRISTEDRFPVTRPGRASRTPRPLEVFRPGGEAADLIPQMVGLVSKANLTKNIQDLQNFQTRYASTQACENAGTSLYQFFSSLSNLQTSYVPFTYSGNRTTRNIVAVLPGKSSASRSVILCAHYDSYSNQASTNAPGADDNASGTSAVMEIARVLSSYAFDFTLKFICFSAEEWGLYGSKDYAQKAKAAGETILGVINMDMIGYEDRAPEDVDVIVNSASEWLGDRYISAAQRYAPLPTLKIINGNFRGSDHSPFWDQGYTALCGIEDAGVPNPYYHKTTDTLSTLNMDFATAVAKASLALAAELAQPVATLPAPSGLQARSQVLSSLFSSVKTVFLTWQSTSSQAVGYNVYRSSNRTSYEKANASLLTTTAFTDRLRPAGVNAYYVVAAVDAQGRESNFSAEVRDDGNLP